MCSLCSARTSHPFSQSGCVWLGLGPLSHLGVNVPSRNTGRKGCSANPPGGICRTRRLGALRRAALYNGSIQDLLALLCTDETPRWSDGNNHRHHPAPFFVHTPENGWPIFSNQRGRVAFVF